MIHWICLKDLMRVSLDLDTELVCAKKPRTSSVCSDWRATSVDPNWKRVFRSVRLDAWKGKKGSGPRYPPLYWWVNRNPPTNHQPTGVLNTAHLSIENLGFQGYPEVFGTDWPVPSISKIFVHNFGKGGAWKRMESTWKPTKNCHFCNRKPEASFYETSAWLG